MDDGLVLILPEYADEPWGEVLILVVVDDGLVRVCVPPLVSFHAVLILVVVDDGLVLPLSLLLILFLTRLNPCCSGRWSRTRPYKTILIINKLKNSTKQFFTFLNRKLTFS